MLRRIGLLAAVLWPFLMHGQLNADFTANVTSGCEPLVVTFTDLSTGSNIISREWHFGYGGNISNNNNPNPSAAYPVAGVYTVTLIISNGTQVDSIVKPNYITVYAKPTVSFSFNPSGGCAPLAVNFANASVAGSGTIASYQWDFDDGSSFSGQANPSHTYNSSGTYTPTLKVTNSHGCHRTQGMGNVNVSGGPSAAFTSTAPQACQPPLTVSFTNQSTGIGPMSYAWDLGVSTSSAQSPSATYTSSGFYDVSLTVTDAYGCQDVITEEDYVGITAVAAEFEVESPVCTGTPISITNNTVGASTFSWAWGDGSTGSGLSPNKVYQTAGTYTITLTAISGTCNDTYTASVTVEGVDADFTPSASYGCEFPHTTTYSDASTTTSGAITSWLWKLGQLNASGTSYAEYSFDSVASITRYFPGTYSDTLVVTNSSGCSDTRIVTSSVVLEELIADFDVTPRRGCAPQQVDFDDTSIPTPSYPIVSWFYNFDNGSSSTSQNAVANYNDTGCYYPRLIIENAFGCKDSLVLVDEESTICFGAAQNAAATFLVDTTCASDSVLFLDNSTDQQYITEYIWGFDDDTLGGNGAQTDQLSIQYQFNDTGWINLQYVVSQYECYDTTYYDSAIYVKGPIAYLYPQLDCDTPMVRLFHSFLLDAEYFYWDFGDGSPLDSLNEVPTHTYLDSGDYIVTLTAYNDSTGCVFEDQKSVAIRNLQVDFEMDNQGSVLIDSAACAPHWFTFTQNCMDNEQGYAWYIDTVWQQGQSGPNFSYYFSDPGFYPVGLRAFDINGCEQVFYRNVFLSQPQADFDWDFSTGCDPLSVTFNDLSTSDTNIVAWQWYLGDNTGYHYDQNPVHTYSAAGSYQIRLTITDSIGCVSLKQQIMPVSFPYVGFYVDTTLCQYSLVNFQNLSNGGGLQYYWNFNNGLTSTAEDPSTLFTDTGSHVVILAIQDSSGCKDTASIEVHVQNKPVPNFIADTTSSPCLPLPVQFVDQTLSSHVETWKWNFGDGGSSAELDTNVAFHNYVVPGLFDVSVQLVTSYGCKGIQTRPAYIEVDGPYAEFGVAPDSACKGDEISFFVKSSDRMSHYQWVFGDGQDTVVSGDIDTITHRYTDTVGVRVPVVIYHDSSEACAIPQIDSVYIHAVYARYSFFPDSVGCGRLNTRLINKSLGDDAFAWDFGDGRSSTQRSPTVYFPKEGSYDVKLFVENKSIGCQDSLIIPFVVFPEPVVKARGDTLICLYDSAWVEAKADQPSLQWSWYPSIGVDQPLLPATWVVPDTTRYLKAMATDSNGCVGVDSILVVVQDLPELDLVVDTTVIIGEEFKLNPSTPDSLIYLWRPSEAFDCDTCKNPWFKAEKSDWYSVLVRDVHGCFERSMEFHVEVLEQYSVDVPDAFTPNGDGVNDAIYVKGWGIKELEAFRIYNRWGQEVFFSDDLKVGWDGTYRGAEQQMDTYAFLVKVKYYDDEERTINGFIELIR
jgi:gliding motility-associated-like protein